MLFIIKHKQQYIVNKIIYISSIHSQEHNNEYCDFIVKIHR